MRLGIPTLTRKLFFDLAVSMIGMGLVIGALFPFFSVLLGFDPGSVFKLAFVSSTLAAGVLCGFLSYLLARRVVRPRLVLLAEHTHRVEQAIHQAAHTGDWSDCSPEICQIRVDSEDILGDCARAFNGLVEALFRAHEIEQAVADFSVALSSQLELGPLTDRALELLLQHTSALGGAVLVNRRGTLVVHASHGLREPDALAVSDHVRRALATGQSERVELPSDVRIEAVLADFQPREVMVVPIVFKAIALGVVVLANSVPFEHNVRWLIQLFRQSFGLALNNALTHEDMQRMAWIDPLTGTYNRRFGLERLREDFQLARRTDGALGLLILDLDRFKTVNDTYGHLAGDQLLIRIADAVRRVLRQPDFVVRYGGDEFVVVLPGAACHDTRKIAERIRHLIGGLELRDGEHVIRCTVSIGVTAYPEDAADSEQMLLHHADLALYRAKQEGRNQLQFSAQLQCGCPLRGGDADGCPRRHVSNLAPPA